VLGAGESPGAEEWLVTPHAVVRYAAARLHVDATPTETRISLGEGVAFLWPPVAGAITEGWQRLTAGGEAGPPAVVIGGPPRNPDATVDRCASLAERSRALAKALLAPPDGGSGDRNVIAEQVTARRLARASCAIAALVVDTLPAGDPRRKEDLLARLRAADMAWRSFPLGG